MGGAPEVAPAGAARGLGGGEARVDEAAGGDRGEGRGAPPATIVTSGCTRRRNGAARMDPGDDDTAVAAGATAQAITAARQSSSVVIGVHVSSDADAPAVPTARVLATDFVDTEQLSERQRPATSSWTAYRGSTLPERQHTRLKVGCVNPSAGSTRSFTCRSNGSSGGTAGGAPCGAPGDSAWFPPCAPGAGAGDGTDAIVRARRKRGCSGLPAKRWMLWTLHYGGTGKNVPC